jgi:hypothetical protein
MAKRKTIVPDLDNPDPIVPEDPDPTESAPPLEMADGPSDGPPADPIPPPAATDTVAPKKRRGRPPGSKNGAGAKASTVKPIIELETVKRELVQGSSFVSMIAKGTKWQPLTDAGALHKSVKVHNPDGSQIDALIPNDRCEMALGLMGPYMQSSGMLSAAQLSDEGKFAIGLAILAGPPIIAGFGMLFEWAFHPKRKEPARNAVMNVHPIDHSPRNGQPTSEATKAP